MATKNPERAFIPRGHSRARATLEIHTEVRWSQRSCVPAISLLIQIQRYFFPENLRFQIVLSNSASSQSDFNGPCYVVRRGPNGVPCFVLTWTNVGKLGWDNPFTRWAELTCYRSTSKIEHLHANGLAMQCRTLVARNRGLAGTYYPRSRQRRSTRRYQGHNDFQVLDEPGYRSLINSVKRAWGYIGLDFEATSLSESLPQLSAAEMRRTVLFFEETDDDDSAVEVEVEKPNQGRREVSTSTSSLYRVYVYRLTAFIDLPEVFHQTLPTRCRLGDRSSYGHHLSPKLFSCERSLQRLGERLPLETVLNRGPGRQLDSGKVHFFTSSSCSSIICS